MVNYLKEFEDAFEDFLDLRIYFNQSELQYKFQGVWTSINHNKEIKKKVDNIMFLFYRQLKHGLNNKSFLKEIQKRLREVYNFLYDIYYDDFENLNKSNLEIKKTHLFSESSEDDVFNYNFFESKSFDVELYKSLENQELEYSDIFISTIKFFKNYKINNNTNPSKLQFENHLLLVCIYCYREMVFDFLTKVDYYLQNYDKINFTKIDIDEHQHQPIVSTIEKCRINLSKIKVARFFKFLMVEQIIYFDLIDSKKNKIKLQNFIQDHFTYKSLNTKQENITNLQREFAETHIEIKEDYNNLIDELIAILNSKRKI